MTENACGTVALVSTSDIPLRDTDVDLDPIEQALRHVGISPSVVAWDEGGIDWDRFDLVLMRSPWDYSQRVGEFTNWLTTVGARNRILNCPHVIAWNLDKERYLTELATRGMAIVPTVFASSTAQFADALAALDTPHVVVKPTVSAGSRDTGLFQRGEEQAGALARHILDSGKTVMVQPAIDTVAVEGEHALMYFDGRYSHAITKGPLLATGGGLLGGDYHEVVTLVEPTAQERRVADAAMRAITDIAVSLCECIDRVPLYARIDLVRDGEHWLLLEAELFEPSYFTIAEPQSADRFAAAVLRRLRSRPSQ